MEAEAGTVVVNGGSGPRSRQSARRLFLAVLVGWNLLMVVLVSYELSEEHRPHVQPGANAIVLGILLYIWVLVNLVGIATALFIRRRRRGLIAT